MPVHHIFSPGFCFAHDPAFGPIETFAVPPAIAHSQGKAEDWKLVRRAPKIKLVPESPRTIRLTEAFEQKLLAAAEGCNWRPRTRERFKSIVVLMRQTGLRDERELLQVRIENIDFDTRTLHVPDSKKPTGVRDVPFQDVYPAEL